MGEALLHLIAADDWARRRNWEPLRSASLATEGFAHCTVGDELMLRVANQFYTRLTCSFVVLSIDRTRLTSPLRWERPKGADALGDVTFPHIYGPIDVRAIDGVRSVIRDDNRSFVGYSAPRALARGMSLVLPTANLQAAIGVYQQLGFVCLGNDEGAVVSRDGVRLHLVEDSAEARGHPVSWLLWVSDVDAIYAEWAALGVPGALTEPVDVGSGERQGSYMDVDGNVIRFASPPV